MKAFPTWVINGVNTEGQLDLPALEALLEQSQQQQQGGGSSGDAAAVAVAAQ